MESGNATARVILMANLHMEDLMATSRGTTRWICQGHSRSAGAKNFWSDSIGLALNPIAIRCPGRTRKAQENGAPGFGIRKAIRNELRRWRRDTFGVNSICLQMRKPHARN